MSAPDAAAVRAYAPAGSLEQITDEVIDGALAAETLAQAAAVRLPEGPEDTPADLREALLRRVIRNLSMRNLPLGVQADEAGGIRLGSNDPEIRRLEGPHRRRVVG